MTIFERINRVASGRSLTHNSHEAESASVATFEFDMDVVRDGQRAVKRGRSRLGLLSIGISDRCDSSAGDRKPNEMLHSMRESDYDMERDSRRCVDDLDRSDRSTVSNSYRTGSTGSFSGFSSVLPNRTIALSVLIGFLGVLSSTLFLGFGIGSAVEDQQSLFDIRARELTRQFNKTWANYETAASWAFQACAFHPISREEFSYLYSYIESNVDIVAVQWIPKILDEDRTALEEEARTYFETNYPQIDYLGITGLEPEDPSDPDSAVSIQYRPTQDYYYPVHLIEPMSEKANSLVVDLDVATSELHHAVLQLALDTFLPVATETYQRLSPDGGFTEEKFIQLLHPGIPIPDLKPKDLAALVIQVETLVEVATRNVQEDISFYIYDTTNKDEEPQFVIAAEVYSSNSEHGEGIVYLDEVSLAELVEETVFYMYSSQINVTLRTWTIAFVALEDTYVPDLRYIILAGKFILVASLCVSLWILTNHRRTRTVLEVKRKADMEKTAVIVRSARENARAEQELNDYIAHEVRNPLAAAMSACTFVKAAVNEQNPMADTESIKAVREDVEIIDSSLTFTHDLLRSMLDMHRAASKKLFIEETPLDVMHDVLEPVLAMLYKRNMKFEIIAECPKNMYILSDRIRLKQILLNLCRNSARYVQKGFIKVGAEIVDNNVQMYVEDSGFGIADERKKHLFSKFQESLNVMDQGSGVGLCLCKSMANLLHGDIWLDENFDSGVPGYPGSRFVVGLKKPPMPEREVKETVGFFSEDSETSTTHEDSNSNAGNTSVDSQTKLPGPDKKLQKKTSVEFTFDAKDPQPAPMQPASLASSRASSDDNSAGKVDPELPVLPENVAVLFVDDDMILRKLFMRSVRKVIDTWDIQEAASGEAALKMTDQKEFDLIFMDQYMASVEKKLLGTETVRALRSKGVRSRICGLSANDVGDGFWSAGADCFIFKPFPCKKEQLQIELHRILNVARHPKLDELAAARAPRDASQSKSLSTQPAAAEEKSKEEELSKENSSEHTPLNPK